MNEPAVVLTFDDQFVSQYNLAYPALSARGMNDKVTAYISTNYLSPNSHHGLEPGMTLEQLTEVHAAGWKLANHTDTHPSLSSLTLAQQEARIAGGKVALDGWGFIEASAHLAYPYGAYNANTLLASASTGMITARRVVAASVPYPVFNGEQYVINCYQWTIGTIELAYLKTRIDQALLSGEVVVILFHYFVESGATVLQANIADFEALLDYIIAVGIPMKNITELFT